MYGSAFKTQRPHFFFLLEGIAVAGRVDDLVRQNLWGCVFKDAIVFHFLDRIQEHLRIPERVDLKKPVDYFVRITSSAADFLFKSSYKPYPLAPGILRLVVVRVAKRQVGGEVDPTGIESSPLGELNAFFIITF